MKQRALQLVVLTMTACAFLLVGTSAASAQPANDDFDSATMIGALPFTEGIDTRLATAAADDPTTCTNNGSVWYAFTPPADTTIEANTFGSNYDTVLSAYTGTRGALTQVPGACNDDFSGLQSRVTVDAVGGTTYYFLVGVCCGVGGSGGADLTFNVNEITGLPNDDFADATPVSALPFSDTIDTTTASMETGEPMPSCAFGVPTSSAWYAFTPGQSESVSAAAQGTFSVVAAYTGNSLADLSEVGCRLFGERLTFRAQAGATYYFQVGSALGQGGPLTFSLDVAPAPVASFGFSPSDPSVFDTVQFFDFSSDPGGVGVESQVWNLGDGTTATGCCPSHRYAVEGDYTVELIVTTFDGRTASTSQVLHVRTHDVAITKFAVPQAASVGQTRQISVGIKNTRYPETVEVQLFKSVPGGFQAVGGLTQNVPVRPANRTTTFGFSYTFTPDDASVGKVTFKAVANLIGARDALPGDNEAIAQPTKVVP